jgi:S-formylglutathione hydrolase FrmB
MALAHVHYWSPALQKQSGMFITLPDGEEKQPRPVVYLLHGHSDDYTIWQRRTSVERYADRLGLIIVMPDGGRSFYVDAVDGSGDYERHILDTIAFTERTFHCRSDRASRGIGGLSMGGYGALKFALKFPHLFASATPHSGALDIVAWMAKEPRGGLLKRLLGAKPSPAEDCLALARKAKRSGKPIPSLRIDCGAEDFLLDQNEKMHAHLAKLGIEHQYEVHPGAHNWEYWDLHVRSALEFHKRVFDGASTAMRKAKA